MPLVQRFHRVTSNEPSVETLEPVAELEREAEKAAEMFDCAIEGEGQGSWMDLAVAAP